MQSTSSTAGRGLARPADSSAALPTTCAGERSRLSGGAPESVRPDATQITQDLEVLLGSRLMAIQEPLELLLSSADLGAVGVGGGAGRTAGVHELRAPSCGVVFRAAASGDASGFDICHLVRKVSTQISDPGIELRSTEGRRPAFFPTVSTSTDSGGGAAVLRMAGAIATIAQAFAPPTEQALDAVLPGALSPTHWLRFNRGDVDVLSQVKRVPDFSQSWMSFGALPKEPRRRASVDAAPERERNAILTALRNEPVEDGVLHPAEALVAGFLSRYGESAAYPALLGPAADGRVQSGVVGLLGRLPGLSREFHIRLVRDCLKADDVQVRDAAVQAAELWEDPAVLPLLLEHKEKAGWLADYVRRVAHELRG